MYIPEPSAPEEPKTYCSISLKVKDILETRVRPLVQRDGGDVEFVSFENGLLKIKMTGACKGCPKSRATLKQGIQRMVSGLVPEVTNVEQVE